MTCPCPETTNWQQTLKEEWSLMGPHASWNVGGATLVQILWRSPQLQWAREPNGHVIPRRLLWRHLSQSGYYSHSISLSYQWPLNFGGGVEMFHLGQNLSGFSRLNPSASCTCSFRKIAPHVFCPYMNKQENLVTSSEFSATPPYLASIALHGLIPHRLSYEGPSWFCSYSEFYQKTIKHSS